MIENPPKTNRKLLVDALFGKYPQEIDKMVDDINEEYLYWDKVRYKRPLPDNFTPEMLWTHVKASRLRGKIVVWSKYGITLTVTNHMQKLCHEFDMNFGSFWDAETAPQKTEKLNYQMSSLMEEAIYSSKMEGASTTRLFAKDMLKKGLSPKDKSEQMIFNNYQTIRYVAEHKNEPLTEEAFLYVHKLMTDKTLKNPEDAGRYRTNEDNIVVQNAVDGEIVHIPPAAEDISQFVNDLCFFFNDKDSPVFIHPIIRGIIIHFMVAYMHPFVDGNGRTARALFYWYMLKEGYMLTEYMSISRVIIKSKTKYEMSFLYTENDERDLGYFVAYNLRVLSISFRQLKEYINRKQKEKKNANSLMSLGNINERQARILQYFVEEPGDVVTVKDILNMFGVSTVTARKDLSELVEKGYLVELQINNVKRGYMTSDNFEELINKRK